MFRTKPAKGPSFTNLTGLKTKIVFSFNYKLYVEQSFWLRKITFQSNQLNTAEEFMSLSEYMNRNFVVIHSIMLYKTPNSHTHHVGHSRLEQTPLVSYPETALSRCLMPLQKSDGAFD